ncbi:hypothetical protein PIB30_056842 [Stylosanthes scabra]|uniref:Uncharacterized protein n=1 Tax=Stylosanthes scabra TaxID=79078 RepID=A0ABU6ZI77_9FABA|nr:hypothetical protein [Stylosanthes scabra]
MARPWPGNVEFPFYPSLNCILTLSRGRAIRGTQGRGRLLLRHQAYVGAAARSGPRGCTVTSSSRLKGAATAAVGNGRATSALFSFWLSFSYPCFPCPFLASSMLSSPLSLGNALANMSLHRVGKDLTIYVCLGS